MEGKTLTPNEYLFVRWMADKHPRLLAAAEDQAKQRSALSGITDSIQNILNSVSAGLSTYTQTKAQAKLVKTNVQRAAQGLPPVTETGALYTVPAADLQTQRMPGGIPVWGWIALGVGALLLFRE